MSFVVTISLFMKGYMQGVSLFLIRSDTKLSAFETLVLVHDIVESISLISYLDLFPYQSLGRGWWERYCCMDVLWIL